MSIVIAVAAVLFTVGSFWWLNARRGRRVGATPAAYGTPTWAHDLLTPFPPAILNTGATRRRGRGHR